MWENHYNLLGVPVIIFEMGESVQTGHYATKWLPSGQLWIRDYWPLSNGYKMCIIFLKVCLDSNISHASGACFPKLNCTKLPALEYPINQ